jgi:hypothetical protein
MAIQRATLPSSSQFACDIGPGPVDYAYRLSCSNQNSFRLTLSWATLFCNGQVYPTSRSQLTAADHESVRLASSGSCDPFDWSFDFSSGMPSSSPFSGMVRVYSGPSDVSADLCASPCPIPRRNLTLSWPSGDATLAGSGTLAWNPSSSEWIMACQGNLSARLFVSGGSVRLAVIQYQEGTNCGSAVGMCDSPTSLTLGSSTCAPFDLVFMVPTSCGLLYQMGYRMFTVTE